MKVPISHLQQEYLEMLGKLQEASQYMAKFKRKQKEKTYGRYLPDSVNTDWSYDHFGYDDDYRVESQRPDSVNTDWSYDRLHTPRNSLDDGSSKDCYEELREAIMEGLAKQDLLPKSCNEGKEYFDRKKVVDLSLECPSSTNSSPTSMFHSREFDICDHSFQWSFEDKAKGPSTFTDMDLPKTRVPQFSVEKVVDSPRRTLEELTQTIQFKGLVTSPSRDRSDHQKQLSKVFDRIKTPLRGDSHPPIVIIKPLQVSGSLEEDVQKQKKFTSQEFDIKDIIKNLKLKQVVPSRTDDGVIRLMEKISSTKMKDFVQEKAQVQVKEVVHDKADILKKSSNVCDSGNTNTNKIVSRSCKKPDTEPTVLQDQISQLKPKPENLVEMQLKYEAIQINPCYDDEDDLAVIKHTTSEEVPAADARNLDYGNKTDKTSDQKANNVTTRNLLFNNPLFINKVEELFYTDAHQPNAPPRQDDIVSAEHTTTPCSPLLDCAKELLQNKSLIQSTKGAHQFTNVVTANKSKMFIFLDQLVGEVCDGFEDLKGYHKKVNGETFAQNTLPKVLHMDLWCKGVVNGGWDFGWKSGFTADEIEQIVVNIEHEILNEIIMDTVADMLVS